MTTREFQLHALIRQFENETLLGEVLHFPEISRLGESTARLNRALLGNARGLSERSDLDDLYHRTAPAEPEMRDYTVKLKPPTHYPLWAGDWEISLQAAVWEIPGAAWVAYVPALRIEVVVDKEDQLAKRVPAQIEMALRRTRSTGSLWRLVALQRATGLRIEPLKLKADIPTPKEVVQREQGDEREKSVLKEVAQELKENELAQAYEYGEIARRIADALGEPAPESVLLVGPSGVGKTAAFHEMVRQRKEFRFGRTPFWATSGSRLVAGMSGFGMWQERCDKLRKEASRTRAILHLGNLVELMEIGKGMMIQQGIAGFLRPFIARGELLCVVEATPEQLPIIERQDPHLLGVFRRVEISEPSAETGTAILMSKAHEIAEQRKRELISLEALETLDRVHRRYATYSSYPGRPLRFLENLLSDRDDPADESDIYAAFSKETGLPRQMLDTSIPLELDQVRRFFNERIIGQDRAVELVIDLLATVKSGLARPRKPLASFLFVGPTGVGKTETSKALAEFLFSDRRRLTRFDMSEYGSPASVQRLIGGVFGEEGLLTSRVREQPFAVLLFDEFEKAHPQFFDLLLQVLGEARLTDGAGRLADFSNTVVIMTSNLGAEGFMQGGIGFDQASVDAQEHFTKALKDFVRPELLNRIDRVVPFMPLDEQAVLSIVRREIELLRQRPGIQATGTTLKVSESARQWLAERAYQPALGARPLKREIERSLLVPLGEQLNSQPTDYSLSVSVDRGEDGLMLDVKPALDETEQPRARSFAEPWLNELADETAGLRRKLQTALASPRILQLRNEMFRLSHVVEMDRRRLRKHKDASPSQRAIAAEKRIHQLRKMLENFEHALEETARLEDELSLAILGQAQPRQPEVEDGFKQRREEWSRILREVMRMDADTRGLIGTLYIYSHHNERMFDLAQAYRSWAGQTGLGVEVYWLKREPSEDDRKLLMRLSDYDGDAEAALRRIDEDDDARAKGEFDKDPRPAIIPVVDEDGFLDNPPEDTGAIVLVIGGEDAPLRLKNEAGLHRFTTGTDSQPVDVDVRCFVKDIFQVERLPMPRGQAGGGNIRRVYNLAHRQASDPELDRIVAWTGSRIDTVLAKCIEATFERELEKQVGL